ncbi:MAG TPA: hypothetical protein VKQ30_23235 [Ktedonobacterales bacterium]|nr:hypothetical protein [Ktedonobacterales bacterium]
MLRKLQRAAARLAGDVPTAPAITAPASPASDEDDEPDEDEPADEEEPDEDEPELARDPRPRGFYVVGGQARSAAGAAPGTHPEPSRPSGFELPGFFKRAKELAEDIKPLTAAESKRLRESTVRSFMQFWRLADEGISATNARRAEAHIWRQVDREETELVVDFLLSKALESAPAAQIVRGIANIWDYYAVGLILGPRFYKTFRFYADHGGVSL